MATTIGDGAIGAPVDGQNDTRTKLAQDAMGRDGARAKDGDNGPDKSGKGDGLQPKDNSQPKDKVEKKDAPEQSKPLNGEEQQRAVLLQNDLIRLVSVINGQLPPAEQKKIQQDLLDEQRGITRDKEGKIIAETGKPVFGPATKMAYAEYVNYLQDDAVPNFYNAMARMKTNLPSKGPIELPLTDTRDGRNNVEHPRQFLSDAQEGKLRFDMKLNTDSVPSWQDLQKLSDTHEWIGRARDQVERANLEGLKNLVNYRIEKGEGNREWGKLEKPEQVAAALQVMDLAKRTARTMEAIDFVKDKIESSKQDWLSPLQQDNLPPGCKITRKDGKPDGVITGITFDLPQTLDLQDPKNQKKLEDLQKWLDKNSPAVEQAMANRSDVLNHPEKIFAFGDVEVPHGWVKFGKDEKGQPTHEYAQGGSPPEGAGWKKFNLLEFRFNTEDVRDAATGDLKGVKVSRSLEYQDAPMWSYLNLYAPKVEGHPDLKPDKGGDKPLDPNEWVSVRTGGGQLKFMKARDLGDFQTEQALMHYGEKALIATMDASMLISGGGAIAAGRRATKIASCAVKTLEVAETAAKLDKAAGIVKSGATLFEELSKDTTRALAQEGLASQGRKQMLKGAFEMGLGASGVISNSAATHESAGLDTFAKLRGLYFMGMMGKDLVFDLPRGMMGLGKAETLADRMMKASHDTAHWSLRGTEAVGQFGFRAVEVPFSLLMAKQLTEQKEIYDNMLKFDPMKAAQQRLDVARNGADKDAMERVGLTKQTPVDSTQAQIEYLDRYRKSFQSLDGAKAKQIDEIINGTKALLEKKEGETAEQLQERRRQFIQEKLAPQLLASGQQIADAEKARADKLSSGSKEFQDKKTFTDAEVRDMLANGKLGAFDKDVQAAAAVAMLHLCRDAQGGLGGKNADGSRDSVLFKRDEQVPAWSVDKIEAAGETAQTVTYKVPRDGQTREASHQEIKVEDLVRVLKQDAASNASADRRIETGDILTRAGVPAEQYGAILKGVIQDSGSTTEQKNRAIANMGAVIAQLRMDEQSRQSLDKAEQLKMKGDSNGLSSADLHAFLTNTASKADADKDVRAFAGYVSLMLSRKNLSLSDVTGFEEVSKRVPPGIKYDEFIAQTRQAALNDKPESVADYERKLQSSLMLEKFIDASGKGDGFTQKDLNRSIATCASAQVKFEDELTKAKTELTRLGNGQKVDEAELQAKRDAVSDAQMQKILAGDVGLAAQAQLLKTVNQNGESRTRIAHLDSSADRADRDAAMKVRTDSLELLKQPNASDEDVRVRNSLLLNLEPLLRDGRRLKQVPDNDDVRSNLSYLRAESAKMLQATLTPASDIGTPRAIGVSQQLKDYAELNKSAQTYSELRGTALGALAQIDPFSQSTRALIQNKMLTENEKDADVRLAAIRAAELSFPKYKLADMSGQILGRKAGDPAHPPETDAAVSLRLWDLQGRAGNGFAPDTVKFMELRQAAKAKDQCDELLDVSLAKVLSSDGYNWVPGKNLEGQLKDAKRNEFSNGFTYWVYDCFTDASTYERDAVKNKYDTYKDNFQKKVVDKAAQGDGDAQKVLFYVLKTSTTDWVPDKQGLDGTGHSGSKGSINVSAEDLHTMQLAAAGAVADACKNDPAHRATLTNICHEALRNANVPADCKLKLLTGLEYVVNSNAAADKGQEQKVEDARAIETAVKCFNATRTQGVGISDGDREKLCCNLLKFIEKRAPGNDPQLWAAIDADDQKGGLTSPAIRQQQLELVANLRDRLAPDWLNMPTPDNDTYDNATRAERLKAAAVSTKIYNEDATTGSEAREELVKAVGGKKELLSQIPADVRKDLQERENRNAVEEIFAACKGSRITAEDDPRRSQLLELTAPSYPEVVREGAALMMATQSDVRADRDEGIKTLSRLAVEGSRLGYKQEAHTVIDGLKDANDQKAAVKEFESMRASMVDDLRKQLKLDDNTSEVTVIKAAQASQSHDKGLLNLANCLTHLGELQLRLGNNLSGEAALRTAMNVYAQQPADAPLTTQTQGFDVMGKAAPKVNFDNKRYEQGMQRLLGSDDFWSASYCMERNASVLRGQNLAAAHQIYMLADRFLENGYGGQDERTGVVRLNHLRVLDGLGQEYETQDRQFQKRLASLRQSRQDMLAGGKGSPETFAAVNNEMVQILMARMKIGTESGGANPLGRKYTAFMREKDEKAAANSYDVLPFGDDRLNLFRALGNPRLTGSDPRDRLLPLFKARNGGWQIRPEQTPEERVADSLKFLDEYDGALSDPKHIDLSRRGSWEDYSRQNMPRLRLYMPEVIDQARQGRWKGHSPTDSAVWDK